MEGRCEGGRGAGKNLKVVPGQQVRAGESGPPAFKKSWSGPLAAMAAHGLRPDLHGAGSMRGPTAGGTQPEDALARGSPPRPQDPPTPPTLPWPTCPSKSCGVPC